MAVSAIMVGTQVLIVYVGGAAFSVVPLDGSQWAICLVLGVLSIPLGVLIRLVPDAIFDKLGGYLQKKWTTMRPQRRSQQREMEENTAAAA